MAVKYPFLKTTHQRLIVDLYDPFFLENMYYYLDRDPAKQMELNDSAIEALNALMDNRRFLHLWNGTPAGFLAGDAVCHETCQPADFSQDPTMRN